jgi:hypothetical protein
MPHLQPVNQENEQVNRRLTLGVMLWVIVFGVLLSGAARLLLSVRSDRLEHARAASAPQPIAAEVSAVHNRPFRAQAEGQERKAAQRHRLQSYGWVDREHGLVRIPIDVAIDLEVEEHAP